MSDIYFSDKRKNNNSSNENSSNDFIESDYFDEEFSLKFNKSKGNAQSFIPSDGRNFRRPPSDNEFSDFISESGYTPISEHPVTPGSSHIVNGIDRTPHGRPVTARQTSRPQQPYTVGPASQRPISEHPDRRPTGAPQSRQPMSRPVQTTPSSAARTPGSNCSQASPQRRPDGYSQSNARPSVSRGSYPQRPQQRPHGTTPGHPAPVSGGQGGRKRRRSSSVKLTAALSVVAVFAVAVLGLFGYAYSLLNGLNYDSEIIENRYLDASAVSDSSLTNILFIGSDARGDIQGQRSDTMILFSIDKKNGQIKLASFLRDSYVYIPLLERKSKINASFSNGGAQATIDTIEYNYGVDIDNYIIIDFVVFEQIVDLLGGITVDVTEREAKYLREEVKIPWVKEGPNDFNGFVSLWYCRIRHLDNDFRRTERQRKVISAVIDKAKSNIFAVPGMIQEVMPNISTDLTKKDILSLGLGALFSYLRYDIVQQQVPANGTWNDAYVNGSYVIKFDEEENKRILREFLLNKVEEKTEE